jgi:hypothetical protein
MIEIAPAIGAITGAIALAKELSSADREIGKAELKLKAAELMSTLADAKIALIEAREEIAQRDAEIARLKESFARVGEVIEHHGYYYEIRDGGPVGNPYCPHCKTNGRWSRLETTAGPRGQCKCPNCQNVFEHIARFAYARPAA